MVTVISIALNLDNRSRATDSSCNSLSVEKGEVECLEGVSPGASGGSGGVEKGEGEACLEDVIRNAVPVAYARHNYTMEAWSEGLIEVRIPAAALKGHSVLILPLDDHRVQELDVLVSPGIYEVSDEGTIKVRIINTSTRRVSVPALAPVARFVVDPRAYDTDLEYTTDETFENITVDGTRSQDELEYLKAVLPALIHFADI